MISQENLKSLQTSAMNRLTEARRAVVAVVLVATALGTLQGCLFANSWPWDWPIWDPDEPYEPLGGWRCPCEKETGMNALMVISPYWFNGTWVFDDETIGVTREPFVAGADDIITAMVEMAGVDNAREGFTLTFSAHNFPRAYRVRWVREECGGNIYEWEGREGWLCPVLLRYFETAPQSIYVLPQSAGEVADRATTPRKGLT